MSKKKSIIYQISDFLDIVPPSHHLIKGGHDPDLDKDKASKENTLSFDNSKPKAVQSVKTSSRNSPGVSQDQDECNSNQSDWSCNTGNSSDSEVARLQKRVDELQSALSALEEKQHIGMRRNSYVQQVLAHWRSNAVLPIKWWWAYLKGVIVMVFVSTLMLLTAELQLRLGRKVQYGVLLSVGGIGAILAVPGTHVVGKYLHDNYKFWQPFRGGTRFVVLQGLSWMFYSIAVVLIFYGLYAAGEGTEGLLGTSGVIVLIAQCFMVSSLFTFNGDEVLNTDNDSLTDMSAPLQAGLGGYKQQPSSEVQINEKVESLVAKQYSFSTDSLLDWWEDESDVDASEEPGSVGPRVLADGTEVPLSKKQNLEQQVKRSQEKLAEMHVKQADSVASQFVQMNVALMCVGLLLGIMAENTNTDSHRTAMAILSSVCCISAITLSHGLGGRMKHDSEGWRFFRPRGGSFRFMVLQTVGWTIFAVSLLCQASFIVATVYFSAKLTEGFMYYGGAAAVIAEILVVLSLQYFRSSHGERGGAPQPLASAKGPAAEADYLSPVETLLSLAVLGIYFNTQYLSYLGYLVYLSLPHLVAMAVPDSALLELIDHGSLGLLPDVSEVPFDYSARCWGLLLVPLFSWVLLLSTLNTLRFPHVLVGTVMAVYAVGSLGTFLFYYRASPQFVQLSFVAVLNLVYMLRTYSAMPEVYGGREWAASTHPAIIGRVERYFGARVVLSSKVGARAAELGRADSQRPECRQVMLGLHPHGVFPSTQVWLQHSQAWKARLPNLRVTPTTASVTHYVPVMRDIAHWWGVRDVSRASILQRLSEGGNPQIVVGGQSEMFESRSWDKGISVVRRRRRGMFRIAMQSGVGVVPMFSFGETATMDNLYMPTVQNFFKKNMGFPIPYWPHGRWFLPIPRRVKLTIAVGEPVMPRRKTAKPTEEEITEFHARYFKALEELFEEFKNESGYPDHYIKWID